MSQEEQSVIDKIRERSKEITSDDWNRGIGESKEKAILYECFKLLDNEEHGGIFSKIKIIKNLIMSDLEKEKRAMYAINGYQIFVDMVNQSPSKDSGLVLKELEIILRMGITLYHELDDYGRVVLHYQHIHELSLMRKDGSEMSHLDDLYEIIDKHYEILHQKGMSYSWYHEAMRRLVLSGMDAGIKPLLKKIIKLMDEKMAALSKKTHNESKNNLLFLQLVQKEAKRGIYVVEGKIHETGKTSLEINNIKIELGQYTEETMEKLKEKNRKWEKVYKNMMIKKTENNDKNKK